MSERFLWKARVIVEDRKREEITGPGTLSGHRWVPDGQSDITYIVEVSEKGILDMAAKAAKSKGGKCVDGPLRVIVTSRHKVEAKR